MKSPKTFCTLLLILTSLTRLALADTAATAPAPSVTPPHDPQTFVLMITTHPGNDMYARHFQDWVTRFQAYFSGQCHIPAANITILSGDANFKSPLVTGPATSDSILTAATAATKNILPGDQFILILMGHGQGTDDGPTLMLPGPVIVQVGLQGLLEDV